MLDEAKAVSAASTWPVGTDEHVLGEGVGQPGEHVAGRQALPLETAETGSHLFGLLVATGGEGELDEPAAVSPEDEECSVPFSGVSGIKPLQNNFLPNCSLL